MPSITSANSSYILGVGSIFPIGQALQGYAADEVFSTDSLEAAETLMGVDGILSAGFVFVAVKQGISLQADSTSNAIFDAWYQAERALVDKIPASGVITLPSLGMQWVMTTGWLRTYPIIPDAKRHLQPRKYVIEWQSAFPQPFFAA